MNEKNNKITILRDMAITFVVLYHSIIIYNNDWKIYTTNVESGILNYISIFLSIFHMPLFFSISGFLFNKTIKKHKDLNLKKLIINKFERLLIPYLFWAICWMLPIKLLLNYSGYSNNSIIYNIFVNILLGRDNGHLWFLPSLFFIFIIFYIINKKIKNEKIKALIVMLITILGYIVPTYVGSAMKNIIWFYLGSYIEKKDLCNKKISKKTINLMIISLILIIIYLCIYGNIPYYNYITLILKIIICCILLPNIYIIVPNKTNKVLRIIEKNSFGIYLVHSPLIYITYTYFKDINPIGVLTINFVVFGGLAMLITEIFRKIKLNKLIGEK